MAQTPDGLADLPDDPTQLLDGLDKQYDIAIRALIKNVPGPYKQMAMEKIREGLKQAAQSDEPGANRMAEAQVAQLEQLIQEADTLTLGWQIDGKQKHIHLDGALTAQTGTKLADQMAAARNLKTKYAGFLVDGAPIQGNLCAVIPADQIEQSLAALEQIKRSAVKEIDGDDNLDDSTRTAAKKLVDTFFGIAGSTIKTGKMDACTSVIVKPKALTVLAAAHVADGKEVDTAVKQLVTMAKEQPDVSFSSVKFDAAQRAGVRFHTLTLAIPEDDGARKVFGESLPIAIGIGQESVYVGLGADSLNLLQKQIDQSASKKQTVAEPCKLQVALTPVLKFVESVEPNPMITAILEQLESNPGKDLVQFQTTAIENGAMYRLLVEEGVLKVIGAGAQMAGGNGGF